MWASGTGRRSRLDFESQGQRSTQGPARTAPPTGGSVWDGLMQSQDYPHSAAALHVSPCPSWWIINRFADTANTRSFHSKINRRLPHYVRNDNQFYGQSRIHGRSMGHRGYQSWIRLSVLSCWYLCVLALPLARLGACRRTRSGVERLV